MGDTAIASERSSKSLREWVIVGGPFNLDSFCYVVLLGSHHDPCQIYASIDERRFGHILEAAEDINVSIVEVTNGHCYHPNQVGSVGLQLCNTVSGRGA